MMGGPRRSSVLGLALAWRVVSAERNDGLAELGAAFQADVEVHSQLETVTEQQSLCEPDTKWSEWSSCSATCGFAFKSRKDLCGQPSWHQLEWCLRRGCQEEMSTVDVNNHVTGLGVVTEWSSTNSEDTSSDLASCIFQLWEVTYDEAKAPLTFTLVGETEGPGVEHPNIRAMQDNSLVLLTPTEYQGLSIGYRNCTPHATGKASSMAEVSTWNLDAMQTALRWTAPGRVLESDLGAQVANLRRRYNEVLRQTLMSVSSQLVVGSSAFLRVQGDGPEPGTGITAKMTKVAPILTDFQALEVQGTEMFRLAVGYRAYGTGVTTTVSARRMYGPGGLHGACAFQVLPQCTDRPAEPCIAADRGADWLLKNLPLAGRYQVKLELSSSEDPEAPVVGVTSMTRAVSTHAQPGVRLSECQVDYWDCAMPGTPKDTYPETAEHPRCSLAESPLPICQSYVDLEKLDKICDSQQYFRLCKGVMKHGQWTCAHLRQNVCLPGGFENFCKEKGCGLLKSCCCTVEADALQETDSLSPNCACESGFCSEGRFKAKSSSKCRH